MQVFAKYIWEKTNEPVRTNSLQEGFSKTVMLKTPEIRVLGLKAQRRQFLFFDFYGHFGIDAASTGCEAWTQYLHTVSGASVHIWNCHKMSGFEMRAKDIWMQQMKAHMDRIEKVVLISDQILIRGSARLMSKFIRKPLNIYKSADEMEQAEHFKFQNWKLI